MPDRQCAAVVLMALGFVSQPFLLSGSQSSNGPASETGTILGIVVNERHEPVAHAIVQVFSTLETPQAQPRSTVPPVMRGSGSASTDNHGRFRISGLELGEYIVAAEPASLLPPRSARAETYATTFYPSTVDNQQAARVSVSANAETTVLIELVRVRGARISGFVASPSGRRTTGMDVRLFHRFGGFGYDSTVSRVTASGTFEISGVPPGWFRLSIEPNSAEPSNIGPRQFAEKLIEVQDRDLDGLALVLTPGAVISGRIVMEPGTAVRTAIGLRVSASPAPEQWSTSSPITTTIDEDWRFQMSGPSGFYQFAVSADRPPLVVATRVTVNGAEAPASAEVELVDGNNDVMLFIGSDALPKPTVESTLSTEALIEAFKSEKSFSRQFEIANAIVERGDVGVLPALETWLHHDDRHLRGNAAFVFARLGDVRGFQVITDILTDRSDRSHGFIAGGNWTLQGQIREDRYYAAHLLGDLRDPKAIPILVPLLRDDEINYIVPWALGEIGDKGAIAPLLGALDDPSPSIRVLAIYALETLHATEALPRLISLLDDNERSDFGAQVSVAEAAKAAIAKLQ